LPNEQRQLSIRALDRRLLEETGPAEVFTPAGVWPVNNRAVVVALAVIVPTVSGLLYWQLGSHQAIILPGISSPTAQGGLDRTLQTSEELHALSERLKERLDQNPEDGVGWALLARSYVEVGRHADAVPLYERAMKLIPEDPQMLADYADALGMLNGRKLAGRPEQLIQRALKIDPNHIKALMLAGTMAFDRKEFGMAVQYWERAGANLPAGAGGEVRQALLSGIAEAKELAGGNPAMAKSLGEAASSTGSGGQSAAISGTVTLAPSLAGNVAPTDTLFVFAREMSGPSMPVAIVRATKKDLPFTFRLDDSTSPMPSRKLSAVGTVVIMARLSKSGQALPQSGDLEGTSEPVKPGASQLAVVIDREVP
jgi:cytochrome c-type biogenesis protein CcmH